MEEKAISGIMLALLFTSMLTLAFNTAPVRAGIIVLDDFNDNTINTDLWSEGQTGGPTVDEINQRLEIFFPWDSTGEYFGAGYSSKCLLRGDFDIQVDFSLLDWPSVDQLGTGNGVRIGLAVGEGGNWWSVQRVGYGSLTFDSPGYPREVYACDFAGQVAGITPTGDMSGKLRLVRSSDTLTGYYFSSGGWVTVASGWVTAGDVSFSPTAWSHDYAFMDNNVLLAFDNFIVNSGHLAFAYPAQFYISVPHYYQVNSIFCGPASLAMVFDFYGPVISQYEIAEVAWVSWGSGGTASLEDTRRASHFSNLSLSTGSWFPGSYRGYSNRGLGYAAFTKSGMTLDQLRYVISMGYPLLVTTWYIDHSYGHYRLIVGYNETHVTFHDPWYGYPYRGPNVSVTNSQFLVMWECASNWGLFVSPWEVTIAAPEKIAEDNIFAVTAAVTYPCPDPFSPEEYPASSCNASIILPEGLSLAAGETVKKTLGTGELYPRNSATVSWLVHADFPGDFTFSVEVEGKVGGSMPQIPEHPAYDYEDRIGGTGNHSVSVTPRPALTALVDIDPQTLNFKSRGKWITAYIGLPEGYNPADINASTILLNGTIAPVLDPKYGFVTNSSEYLVDHNGDGFLERMVKFDRAAVGSFVCSQGIRYGDVALTMTGTLFDETLFEATGTVELLFPGDADGDADVDFNDFIIFAGCYGISMENPSYVPRADFNEDGTIDFNDFIILAGNYGKTAL